MTPRPTTILRALRSPGSRTARWLRILPVLLLGGGVLGACSSSAATGPGANGGSSRPTSSSTSSTSTSTTTTTTIPPFTRIPPGPPADQRHLVLIDTISGHISPKSVDASDTGLVFAQNMMYTHTMTVYSSAGNLIKTISDGVNMGAFGYPGHPGITHGAPVEGAFTPDSKYFYVSNYSMYGVGMGPEGNDVCTPASALAAGGTNSYLYRVNTKTLQIDQVIEVGLVPKFVAVSPNGKYVLVTNWCGYNLDIVDVATAKVVATLSMGAYPRGIVISPDSSTAYVAVMGGYTLNKVDLNTLTVTGSIYVGANPRSVVIDPKDQYLYVSLNSPGEVVKVDIATGQVVATVQTGVYCRSLAISTDGTALYVVNYLSDTMTMLRASDLAILQTVQTGFEPIGITYDAMTGNVWVAIYSGQILVYATR